MADPMPAWIITLGALLAIGLLIAGGWALLLAWLTDWLLWSASADTLHIDQDNDHH